MPSWGQRLVWWDSTAPSAVVGTAMAELIMDGRSTVVDITPLRLTRFDEGEPYAGPYPYE